MVKSRLGASLIVLALGTLGCVCGAPNGGDGPRAAEGHLPMAVAGPTEWMVDGQQYSIHSTYYVVIDGEGQYVAEWVLPEDLEIPSEESAARVLARPLMEYIVREGHHRRSRISRVGAEDVDVEWIGVALMRRGVGRSSGYRTRERVSALTSP